MSIPEPSNPNDAPSFVLESEKVFNVGWFEGMTIPEESVVIFHSTQHSDAPIHENYTMYLRGLGHDEVPRTALVGVTEFHQYFDVFMATSCSVQRRAILAQMAKRATLANELRSLATLAHSANCGDIKVFVAEKLSRRTRNPRETLYLYGFDESQRSLRKLFRQLRTVGMKKNLQDLERAKALGSKTSDQSEKTPHVSEKQVLTDQESKGIAVNHRVVHLHKQQLN